MPVIHDEKVDRPALEMILIDDLPRPDLSLLNPSLSLYDGTLFVVEETSVEFSKSILEAWGGGAFPNTVRRYYGSQDVPLLFSTGCRLDQARTEHHKTTL